MGDMYASKRSFLFLFHTHAHTSMYDNESDDFHSFLFYLNWGSQTADSSK